MNYYIIPKNSFNIKLNIKYGRLDEIVPYISQGLVNHINEVYIQILKLQESNCENDNVIINYINKIINPFEFIYTNVPGSTISVSKVKPDSIIFFELMELFQIFNIIDVLSTKDKINIAHLTNNYTSTSYLLNMLREENEDNMIFENFDYNNLDKMFIKNNYKDKFDLLIFQFNEKDFEDIKKYINNMILVLLIIIKYQMKYGICIIKLSYLWYKPLIDIIFIISGLFDKIYLAKPSISDIRKGERYLICKGFNNIDINIEELMMICDDNGEICVNSLIDNELPYYLVNKLEESNLVIGQQQLESYDLMINIFKNKNREEKIENLKRIHIQKCVQWCEKNQLPHNKFIDKVNIFLTQMKKEDDIDN